MAAGARRAPCLRAAWGVLLPCLLAACTTVTVHNASVSRFQVPGLTVLQIHPDATDASVVVTQGFGLVFGGRSATLGYLDETVMLVPDAAVCRVFILVRTAEELAALRASLRDGPLSGPVCVLTQEKTP